MRVRRLRNSNCVVPILRISFHSVLQKDPIRGQRRNIRTWIAEVIESENPRCRKAEISYIFCDDEYLQGLNEKYLRHQSLTDIITFDYSGENHLRSDIFISLERVAENAGKYGNTIADEILRVMVHGVLHLLGYRDKSVAEKLQMRRMEDLYLQRYSEISR